MSLRRAVPAFAACCLSAVALTVSLPAFADSYTTYLTSPDNEGNIDNYGLTSTGTVVLQNAASLNYEIFTPPDTITTSDRPPALTYDNGTACTPINTGAFAYVGAGRCNGDYEVFEASMNGNTYGLYTGDDPVADLLLTPRRGDFLNFLLNSEGDVAVVGAGTAPNGGDQNYLFIRSQTPEPSSVALLGTGLLGAAGLVRRRMGTRAAV